MQIPGSFGYGKDMWSDIIKKILQKIVDAMSGERNEEKNSTESGSMSGGSNEINCSCCFMEIKVRQYHI